jgi:hypothetical protein
MKGFDLLGLYEANNSFAIITSECYLAILTY